MPTRARAHTSRRRTPARDSGVREPRRGPLPGVSNRPADAFRRRRSGRPAQESGPSSDTAVVVGRAVVVAEVEPACGEAAFSAGAVKVNERRFDGPGVQRRRSLFASAVVDAGICERRTRLAGPLFRPAGCAVARAGVRRPSRGRRPSRPRDGGRTALPGPAGGGVRPAGGAGVRSGCSSPAPGADGTTVRASQPLDLARREQGAGGGGTPPKRRAGRPARGPRRTDRIQRGPRRSRALSGPVVSPRGTGGVAGESLLNPPGARRPGDADRHHDRRPAAACSELRCGWPRPRWRTRRVGVRAVPRARHQAGNALPVRRPAGPVAGAGPEGPRILSRRSATWAG